MLKNITLQSTCPRKMSTALFVLFSMSGFRPNTPRTVKSQVRERARQMKKKVLIFCAGLTGSSFRVPTAWGLSLESKSHIFIIIFLCFPFSLKNFFCIPQIFSESW